LTKVGKWIAVWFAAIATPVIVAVLIWWLIHPGGVLNREPPPPTPPHAPPIVDTQGGPLYDEQLLEVTVGPGAKVTLEIMKLWSAPEGTPVDCATGFVSFTWIVRSPYPEGDEDLEIRQLIPMGNGRTEVLGRGSTGSGTIGWCNELILFNTALEQYHIEIRYASGVS
jgi:hypothetical protein